jgi:hypothetical protein
MKISENKSKLAALAAAPVLALAIALIGGTFATQQALAGGGGPHQFAVGGFTAMDTSQVAFAAQFNPQTGSYAGHVVQTDMSGVSRHGPVTCLTTDGVSSAVVVWTVTKSDNPADVGTMRAFEVMDGGEPPTGMDMYKDRGTDTFGCSFDVMGTYVPVVRGNIVVKQTGP